MRTAMRGLVLLLLLGIQVRGAIKLPENGRILFLGDSITHAGQYVEYFEAYLRTRFPAKKYQILNLGLPSETVSGLSEPGHAGGSFPRPDLHERLDRVLQRVQPHLIFACYGMNDGIYYPFSQERFEAYQKGIERLVEKAAQSKAKIILLTPPTFDATPLKGRTLPAGRDEYREPYEGYDDVLARYAEWLTDQRRRGWTVIDIHGPMKEHLSKMRTKEPGYLLAGDGVHANPAGHLLFTKQLLTVLKFPTALDKITVNAKRGTRNPDGSMDVQFVSKRPLPRDPQWKAVATELEKFPASFNDWNLKIKNLEDGNWTLLEGTRELGTFPRSKLEEGLHLSDIPEASLNTGGSELLKLIHQRQHILTDAWLADVGHKRPGMAKGLGIPQAEAKAAELEKRIQELAGPARMTLTLKPGR
jgi:lysophospholipase L1-like esterase